MKRRAPLQAAPSSPGSATRSARMTGKQAGLCRVRRSVRHARHHPRNPPRFTPLIGGPAFRPPERLPRPSRVLGRRTSRAACSGRAQEQAFYPCAPCPRASSSTADSSAMRVPRRSRRPSSPRSTPGSSTPSGFSRLCGAASSAAASRAPAPTAKRPRPGSFGSMSTWSGSPARPVIWGLSEQPPHRARSPMRPSKPSGDPTSTKPRVRLTISGGDLSLLGAALRATQPGAPPPQPTDPTILIVAQPATEYPAPMFDRGVAIALADARANPLNPFEGHTTLNYWWRLRELQTSASKGGAEALVLSVTNPLIGGCAQQRAAGEGRHALDTHRPRRGAGGSGRKRLQGLLLSPVLPGIARSWAIDQADRLGLSVRRQMLSVQDVFDAEEPSCSPTRAGASCSSSRSLEASDIGDAKPGRVARALRDAWLNTLPTSGEPL